jgi:hypothetical protein
MRAIGLLDAPEGPLRCTIRQPLLILLWLLLLHGKCVGKAHRFIYLLLQLLIGRHHRRPLGLIKSLHEVFVHLLVVFQSHLSHRN